MNASKISKAAGVRWFAARVGQTLDTHQVRASTGAVWAPGPRALAKKGSRFTLDGSAISLTPCHVVTALDDESLTIAWHWDESCDDPINVTTYTVVASSAEVGK